jgi:hypothetical protein
MLFFAFLAFSQRARAQEYVYSVSNIAQVGLPSDPGGVMQGYSETGMTYGIAVWYNAVHVSILQRDGVTVEEAAYENFPSVFNYTSAPLQAGSLYQQFTESIVRAVSLCSSGLFYDPYGFSQWTYLPYGESATWAPRIAACINTDLIYLGYTEADEQAYAQCQNTCDPCLRDRHNRELVCGTVATPCELEAWGAYSTAILTCDNQAYCDPANPAFDQAQCNACKNTAWNNLVTATDACGASATGCFLTVPSCALKHRCSADGMTELPCN